MIIIQVCGYGYFGLLNQASRILFSLAASLSLSLIPDQASCLFTNLIMHNVPIKIILLLF